MENILMDELVLTKCFHCTDKQVNDEWIRCLTSREFGFLFLESKNQARYRKPDKFRIRENFQYTQMDLNNTGLVD